MTIGETDFSRLMQSLEPKLEPEVWVYATLGEASGFVGLSPIMMFTEAEGVTGIIPRAKAQAAGIEYTFACRRIILQVHSSLEAVGLIATIAEALESSEIPANVVSAYYHDHLFIPEDDAERAEELLKSLAALYANPDAD